MGYKYGDDEYAIIDPEEINKLRPAREQAINIDKFVPPGEIADLLLGPDVLFAPRWQAYNRSEKRWFLGAFQIYAVSTG